MDGLDFNLGQRVKIVKSEFAKCLVGATGTVVGHDPYTVRVRLDTVTPEMMNYEDARTGLVEMAPYHFEKM